MEKDFNRAYQIEDYDPAFNEEPKSPQLEELFYLVSRGKTE